METADEGRQHVAVLGVVVVVGAVEVGGHHGDVVCSVLAVEELAVLEATDFGQGIGLIGLFQLTGEEAALGHGLGRHAGVDAAAAQKLEFLAAVLPGGVDDVHLQNHIVVHEVRQGVLVGHDAAHFGGGQEHVLRTLIGKEVVYGLLVAQVQFLVGTGDDVGIALSMKLAHNGAAHHAVMTGYVYFAVLFHHFTMPFSRHSARLVLS